MKPKAMKAKKIPQRTCIGCRTVRPKKEMLRIVRTPTGEVVLDTTGKKAGRGTYICPEPQCMEKALKGDCLAKTLEVTISPEIKQSLRDEVKRNIDPNL
jgi:predicted RNA-binding protein YlxR (DUF448 family)